MDGSSRHMILVVLITMGALFGLSCLPWSELTGNRIKDFNLFEDLFPKAKEFVEAETMLDPELEALMNMSETSSLTADAALAPSDSIISSGVIGSVDTAFSLSDSVLAEEVPVVIEPFSEAPVLADGSTGIENYTGGPVFSHFSDALRHVRFRPVRVAVLGDSFIEGDILTQNLRDGFQDIYGGRGVGYMNMYSELPGFRQSVRQSGTGWNMKSFRDMRGSDTIRVLAGEYGKAAETATSTYKGAKFSPRTQAWSRSSFIFIAPSAGTVSITGSNGEIETMEVAPSPNPQILTLDAETTSAKITANVPGIIGLGVYLTDPAGVQVDCMSIRGYSGISHRKLNESLTESMSYLMPYDLIILEYGMNALSAAQTNYKTYENAIVESIECIRKCYPQADILVLGISDRGVKKGGTVKSMSTCPEMTEVQRRAASRTGSHFWDMRAAMGGQDAVVQWRKDKLVNADYIHLNHDGGREMASRLLNAIQSSLNE